MRWILIGIVALIALLIVAKFAMKGDSDGIKVTASTVKKGTIVETVSASGKIYPETEVKVGAGMYGEVTDLFVEEGDTIKKGQILARILESNKPVPIRLNSGGDYSNILQTLQNPPKTSGTVSLTSPINGTVSMLNVRKGERLSAMQTEVLRVADMKTMEVRVDVNENDIIKVAVDDSADVEVEAYNKRKFKGVVTKIAYNVMKRDVASFMPTDATSYEVHIRLDQSTYHDLIDTTNLRKLPFRPGMNARADIKTKKKENVLMVPVGAVASRAKDSDENMDEKKEEKKNQSDDNTDVAINSDELEEVVFVIDNENKVERRVVTTGIQDINNIEIVSGLNEGEKIVTGPYNVVSKTLRKGKKVRVIPQKEFYQKD